LQDAAARAGLEGASLVVHPLDLAAAAVTVNAGADIYPASMIKVPLVAAALDAIATGRLDGLEAQVEITAANMTANDAESPLVPGYRTTVHDLMARAIARSDNVATNVLFDLLGRKTATAIAQDRLNLPNTSFHRKLSGSDPLIEDPGWDGASRNSHPAADCAHLMRRIANDDLEQAALLRGMLAEQVWNDKLSAGLRAGDAFAHKTGDTTEVTHDGGILTTQSGARYVIVVYTELPSSPENNRRFGPFMRTLLEML
jgi:beta-lactamase class A